MKWELLDGLFRPYSFPLLLHFMEDRGEHILLHHLIGPT